MEEKVPYQKKQGAGSNTPATQNQKLSTHKVFDEEIVTQVNNYIKQKESEGLILPADYSATNALASAKLHLLELRDKDGNLIVDQVTLPSVVNSLTRMVTSGWNVAKHQCSFIKYGNQLICQPEYFGNLLIAKRDANVKEVNGQCVYQGDEFVYEVNTETGRMKLVKHVPKLENRNNTKIKGAYAIVVYNDNTTRLEVMTIEEIRNAWNMGAMKGGSPAHKNFTDQMAIKSVENRAVKIDINTSDDSEIMPDDLPLQTRETKKAEASNKKDISTEDIPYEDLSNEPPAEQLAPQGPAEEPASLSTLGSEGQTEKAPY